MSPELQRDRAASAAGRRALDAKRARAEHARSRIVRRDLVDMAGQRVGDWTVLRYVGPGFAKTGTRLGALWLCRCACGREARISGVRLRQGHSKRCNACRLQQTTLPASERRCRWCGRATKRQGWRECSACSKSASRHGREADGRPKTKGARRVLA